MLNYCAFIKDHKCIKWEDYQLMMQEIEEADELCHGNWIEIEKNNTTISWSYRKSLITMELIILYCCNLIRGFGTITPDPQVCPS